MFSFPSTLDGRDRAPQYPDVDGDEHDLSDEADHEIDRVGQGRRSHHHAPCRAEAECPETPSAHLACEQRKDSPSEAVIPAAFSLGGSF